LAAAVKEQVARSRILGLATGDHVKVDEEGLCFDDHVEVNLGKLFGKLNIGKRWLF
jgi:hypothetical protein